MSLTEAIARGDPNHRVACRDSGEVGELMEALERMAAGLKNKAEIAETISGGDFTVCVPLASDDDVMGSCRYRPVRRAMDVSVRLPQEG